MEGENACRQIWYVLERLGGMIVAVVFFVIGFQLTKEIKMKERHTAYDMKIYNDQMQAAKLLW